MIHPDLGSFKTTYNKKARVIKSKWNHDTRMVVKIVLNISDNPLYMI